MESLIVPKYLKLRSWLLSFSGKWSIVCFQCVKSHIGHIFEKYTSYAS